MGDNWLSEKIKRYLFGNISDDEVRQRMYNNLLPWGYHTPIKRVRKTVKRNEPEHRGNVYGVTDDVFAEYLQIPKEERRKPIFDEYLVVNSKYVPQKSSENKLYKTIRGLHMDTDRSQSIRDEIINKAPKTIGENVVTSTQNLIGPFGDFTIGRGFDNKGEYVSYYDSYDINPLKGRFRSSLFESKKDDLTFGIGKPVEYYDRIYLDDYYDIPEEARGNPFIAPAVVTAYKKGGRIHIKKKNRGKFTEYCGGKVTEECIAKGKNSKDPKIRKKATFAANARRWKHENGGILKAQEGTGNSFWSKLWNAVKEGGMAARDAKIGAIGAQQVRDLYAEGQSPKSLKTWLKDNNPHLIRRLKSGIMDFAQLSQQNSVLKSIYGAMAPYYYFGLSYKDYANNKYEDVAQSSFLFSPEEQEDAFLSSGYIKGQPNDYGLVQKAVGNKSIPVYQKVEDDIDRNNLEPIVNTYTFFGPTPLEHAGNYPTTLYIDKDYNIYQKGWDFNNYGKDNNTSNNSHKYYSKLKQFAANTLDRLGNPVVRTTGFQKLDSNGINQLIHRMSLKNPDLINNLIGKNKQFDEQYNSIVNQGIENAYSDYINEVVLPTMFDGRGRQNTTFEEWKAAENSFPIEKFKKHVSEYEKFLHNRRIIIDHGTPKLKLGYKNGGILKMQNPTKPLPQIKTAATFSDWLRGTWSYLSGNKDSKLLESQYRPTKETDSNAKYYYRDGLNTDVIKNILGGSDYGKKNWSGEDLYYKDFNDVWNRLSVAGGRAERNTDNSHLGAYTIGIGEDNKGRYISYYDKFDWAPAGLPEIFHPYEIYNRIYEDEFNNTQSSLKNITYSGYNPSGKWFFKSGIEQFNYEK